MPCLRLRVNVCERTNDNVAVAFAISRLLNMSLRSVAAFYQAPMPAHAVTTLFFMTIITTNNAIQCYSVSNVTVSPFFILLSIRIKLIVRIS